MTMLKHIRRLACVAAVGIAVLALAAPARAELDVTFFDTLTSATMTISDYAPADSGIPGTISFTANPGDITLNGTFGNFTIQTFTIEANYNAGPPPGPSSGSSAIPAPGTIPAYTTDATITATASTADTLTVQVSVGNWTIPPGNPVSFSNSQTASDMSAGTTSVYGSTVGPDVNPTESTTLTGPVTPPATSGTGAGPLLASNSTGAFSIGDNLALSYSAGGEVINVNATTTVVGVVPEPSTMNLALGGGLLMLAGGWVRRRRCG